MLVGDRTRNPGELHPCSLVVVDFGECFRYDQGRRVPAVAWDWLLYRHLGGVLVGAPAAEAGTVVGMMAAAVEQRPQPTGVLGHSEGGRACGSWSCDCYRNRSGPDDC